jgi:hypothetical protein
MATLGEENIKITTSGVMAAERKMNSLGRAMSKIEGLVRLITTGGALSVGAILHESMSGTAEGERFNKALENLTRTIGDQFAPWVRSVTRLMNDWAKTYRALTPETQAMVSNIALMVVAGSALGGVLVIVIRGISGMVTLMRVLAVNPWTSWITGATATVAAILAVTAAGAYLFQAFTEDATRLSKTQFEISRGWVQIWGGFLNKIGIISDKDIGFINQKIGAEQEARRLAAKGAAAGGAGGGGDLKGFTPFIRPEFQSPQAGWERLMKGLAANDPLADIGKAQLAKLGEMDDKLAQGLGAVEKLNDMIPAVR